MLTAFVLLCAVAQSSCDYLSAAAVFAVPAKTAAPGEPPEPPMSNPMTCALRSQQWAALHVKVTDGYFIKTLCVPPNKLPGNVG